MAKTHALLVAFALLTISVASVYADDPPSLAADTSFGLVWSPLDAALNVTEASFDPGFSSLGHSYVLGGLGNLNRFAAAGDNPATVEHPVFLGFYINGRFPLSVSGGFVAAVETDDAISDSVALEYGEVVDSTTDHTDTTYRWIKKRTGTTYDVSQAALYTLTLGYIQSFGPLNAGLSITGRQERGDRDDPLGWAESNRTIVETFNYDAEAGSPPPEARFDYRVTSKYHDPQLERYLEAEIPLYLELGGGGHELRLSGRYLERDDSSATSVSSTEPEAVGPDDGTLTDSSTGTTDRFSSWTFGGRYGLSLGGNWGETRRHLLSVAVGGGYDMHIMTDLTSSAATSVYSVDMAAEEGQRKVLTSTTATETTTSRAVQDTWCAEAEAAERLHFDLGEHIFRIGASLSGRYSNRPEGGTGAEAIAESVVTDRYTETTSTDTDADGAVDGTVVTTREYQINAVPLYEELGVIFELPVAVDLSFGDRFGLLLGSRPSIGWRRTRVRNADVRLVTETVEEYAGEVAEDSLVERARTEIEVLSDTPSSHRLFSQFDLMTSQRIALRVVLPQGVMLDAVLNWNNLFDLDDLTIQAAVPLP